jgi:hypothetical protein
MNAVTSHNRTAGNNLDYQKSQDRQSQRRLPTLPQAPTDSQGSGTAMTPSLASTECDPISHETDAMTGTIGGQSTSKEFFGRSSIGSFVRQVSSVIGSRAASVDPDLPPAHSTGPENGQFSKHVDHRDYLLPPRRYADDLLEAYYDLVWAVFPILDRTVFQKRYEGCWLGSGCTVSEQVLYCMINLIFALGSQFSAVVEPSQRNDTGRTFWHRAKKLYHQDKHNASLERVQCLLLMGLYLQSTSESYECWMTVGSAIRMAQSLGLHSCTQPVGLSGQRQYQITRRVWHGCVYQDRYVSVNTKIVYTTTKANPFEVSCL